MMCSSHEQVEHYLTLSHNLGASFLPQHLAGLGVKAV